MSTDPYGQYASPYLGMGNNPISSIDPDGGWVINAIAAVVGGAVSGGISYYNQGGFSGKKVDWGRVALATGSGALAGATLNLGAAVAINMSSDVGDQLIANGGNLRGINITQTAVSGVTTYVGGKIGGALLSKNVLPSIRTIIDKVHADKAFLYGAEVVGHNLPMEVINKQALNLATGLSEVVGGAAGFGASKLAPQFSGDPAKKIFQNFQNQMFNNTPFTKPKAGVTAGPLTELGSSTN